ncbi:hypothetical protein ACC805_34300 [Rhizobium ruizarguesonis]|nr:hypothetical protein ELH74_03005 [Rhizobium ruizarguesonis]
MLGDFVNSSVTRGGDGITQYLTGQGPGEVISATGDVAQWLGGLPGGKDKVNGKTFAQHVKAWVPGSSLWYTKAATDRLIFDNIQAMIDPNYRQSFNRYEKRMKKDFGQTFWWAPGDGLPQRAPNMVTLGR